MVFESYIKYAVKSVAMASWQVRIRFSVWLVLVL